MYAIAVVVKENRAKIIEGKCNEYIINRIREFGEGSRMCEIGCILGDLLDHLDDPENSSLFARIDKIIDVSAFEAYEHFIQYASGVKGVPSIYGAHKGKTPLVFCCDDGFSFVGVVITRL